jgi:Flavin reductase like domain
MGILVRDPAPLQALPLGHLFRSGMRDLAGGVSIITVIERHSHAIVIGKVVAVRLAEEADALLYWRGAYEGLGRSERRGGKRSG